MQSVHTRGPEAYDCRCPYSSEYGCTYVSKACSTVFALASRCDSEVLGYVRARMLFAVLRATNLCIRGSRVRRVEIEDGAGLPYLPE